MTEELGEESHEVDYSNIRYAPVINTVVTREGKILLVQRSEAVGWYKGYWNGISGFLDDGKSIEEKAAEELSEELGLKDEDIISLKRGTPLIEEAPEYNKSWIVVPVLAEVRTDEFQLDQEAQNAEWFLPEDALKLKLVPGFDKVISQFFPDVIKT